MIRFWRNTTARSDGVLLTDQILSYTIGVTFVLLFTFSAILNLISFTYQCLNKPTISRRLFQLLAITDLVTALYFPLYAAYMSFKPDLLPELAGVGVVEAVFLKLGGIPIYHSVVITSLLSIARYVGVSDPLSVKRAAVDVHFRIVTGVIASYTVAILVTLVYCVVKSHTSLFRGAGLTVYFWDVRVLVDVGETSEEQPHLNILTALGLIQWVPALIHCIVGFVTSIWTMLLLRNKERRLSHVQLQANASSHLSVNSIKVNTNFTTTLKHFSTPELRRKHITVCSKHSPIIISCAAPYPRQLTLPSSSSQDTNRKISPSLTNNRRGAVTIFLMNIGNFVWLANFLIVLLIEFKKEYFGFLFLDSARFVGRLLVPQVMALLNPAIVVYRSSEIQASCRYYLNLTVRRIRRRFNLKRRSSSC